ncbi:paralemmin 1a [Stigmatopora argus]
MKRAVYSVEIKVERDESTGESRVLSSHTKLPVDCSLRGVKVYEDEQKVVHEVNGQDAVRPLSAAQVDELICKAELASRDEAVAVAAVAAAAASACPEPSPREGPDLAEATPLPREDDASAEPEDSLREGAGSGSPAPDRVEEESALRGGPGAEPLRDEPILRQGAEPTAAATAATAREKKKKARVCCALM